MTKIENSFNSDNFIIKYGDDCIRKTFDMYVRNVKMLEYLNSNMILYINELENYNPREKVKFTRSNSVYDVLKLDCNLTGSLLCSETIKKLLHMLNSSYESRFAEIFIELDSIYNPRSEGQSQVLLHVKKEQTG